MNGIDVARTMLGWTEIEDEERLKAFFKKYSVHNDIYLNPNGSEADGQPWCAAFVNACERAAYGLQAGTGKLNARSFLDYGIEVEWSNAQVGDILIFTRGNNSWQGHVAYLAGKKMSGVIRLGGNQGDSVCLETVGLGNLIGIRRSPFWRE